ncbi:AAA family ATPase [Clostridium sporogenes]|uniref:AAA family ATPase n=1 Tax=Clostridium sporogenes TaxID=1509 RepID=UPI001FAE2C9F|nr:AAA family ATPase [Clostridium sporogenes]
MPLLYISFHKDTRCDGGNMIHSINIKDFRLFKDVNINLGKYLTAISGKNALGKTTLLALLGNSCEIKVGDGKPILQRQFRTEFGEIFKASPKYDLSGSNKCTINFSDINSPNEITSSRKCRTTWQTINKEKLTKRFRLIPEAFNNNNIKISSAKYHWPSLYLGLSRLFPIGESREDGMVIKSVKLSEPEKKFFVENYKEILNLNDNEEISIDSIGINETERKKGVGISTSYYDSITNSAGQDNIGQIILSVLSFIRLKEAKKEKYTGGLLLIDEIDATLHPVAQIKLLKFLISSCKTYELQVVFTTHSITLLKNLCTKIDWNRQDNINDIEIVYITKDNGPLEILRNPSYTIIYNDLNIPSVYDSIKKLNIYSEDAECRWFFEKLIEKYKIHVDVANITLGCSELLRLNNADPIYFSNIIFVLDGDVADKDILKNNNNKYDNIIKLPGSVRPEQVIYEYLLKLSYTSDFWVRAREIGFTKENIIEHGPLSKDYRGKERDRYKKWFKNNLQIFECLQIYEYWKKDNEQVYDEFINNFIRVYNKIASRKFYPKIIK